MPIAIRAARRADLPAVYDVLDRAFDAPLQLFIDQTEGDSTLRMRQVRVAEVDGRIMAHVRIFQRTMLVRGVPVAAGGIGSVAAHPDARGLGLPTALLNDTAAGGTFGALGVMHRGGTPVSFLFTGIPAFYERLGWRVVREPQFTADPAEAAAMPRERGYRFRRIEERDAPALLSIYRRAIADSTGAIARTRRTWRDAQQWLGEDPAGCLLAVHAGRPVAYIRSRARPYGYDVLEAEHLRGHEAAVAGLLARASRRAQACKLELLATAPDDSALAAAFRTLASSRETTDVQYPMMMRIVALRSLLDALLPQLRDRADAYPGEPFTLSLTSPDGETVTLGAGASKLRLTRGAAAYRLDASGTLDALFGQARTSALVRPRPPAGVARRIDALLPAAPLHFWNSDRI